MIALLTGKVASIVGSRVTLDVNGVGYEVIYSRSALSQISDGDTSRVVIHTEVKEDSIKLYGFADELEKQVFLLLLQVKGIGARTSSDIISKVEKRELLRLIASGQTEQLKALRGIGKKTAERIVVELKDKVADYLLDRQAGSSLQIEIETLGPAEEASQALQVLGFSRRDAEKAIEEARKNNDLSKLQPGDIVREALRYV